MKKELDLNDKDLVKLLNCYLKCGQDADLITRIKAAVDDDKTITVLR